MRKLILAAIFSIAMCTNAYSASDVIIAEKPYVDDTYEWPNPYKDICQNLTEEEIDLIERITWAEANNQSMDGQLAVIEVIFNRVLSDEWPNTIIGVLSQKGQFATWEYRYKVTPTHIQADALQIVSESSPILPSTKYTYFDTKGRNGRDHIRIQDHYFGRGK